MMKVSASSMTRWKNHAEKLMERMKAVREKSGETVEKVVDTTVSTGTAFMLGVVQGKTGGVELFGVPLDLLVGIGAHAAGISKMAGRSSHHMHSVGNGALASYATTMGRSWGAQWKATGKFLGGVSGEPQLPIAGAAFASDEELAAAALRR